MKYDFAIYSKRVVTPKGIQAATVCILDGKIAAIEKGLKKELNCPLENVGESVLMPGLIDAHVHVNEPGRTDWEGFDTATKAAAAGGITTLVDMPLNSSPVTISPKHFEEKLQAARKNIHINCGFWGGIVPANCEEIEGLIKSGVLGIKAFLTHSGIDEFPNVEEKHLRKGLKAIAESSVPLLAHCELDARHEDEKYLAESPSSYKAYLLSRPKVWENNAIDLMIKLCREFDANVHIVHVSSAEALSTIQKAKEEGLKLTAETCPHYLYFSAEQIPDGNTLYKCAPPIREAKNNKKLWEAVENGVLDFIASDHSPAPPEIKQIEGKRFDKAWGGIAGIQFTLPILWTMAKEKEMSIEKIVNLLAQKPVQFINFENSKGKIAVGFDADLTIWDPEQKFRVTKNMIQFRHQFTPYIDQTFYGVVKQTYVNGKKVFDKGDFLNLNEGKILIRKTN